MKCWAEVLCWCVCVYDHRYVGHKTLEQVHGSPIRMHGEIVGMGNAIPGNKLKRESKHWNPALSHCLQLC